ncbi:Pseudouridine-5'-phosphate glycosidase [Streptomyces fumanus]
MLDGRPRVGLDEEQLERIADADGVRKLGHRDLPLAVASGAIGATTVSATALLAARAGIRVFATGGLGGVHREWTATQDESADLGLLARTRITVVFAVKSILDVPATLQRLETLGVAVAQVHRTGSPASTCPTRDIRWTGRCARPSRWPR